MKKHVVFVHGWGVNSGIWAEFIPQFLGVYPNVICHTLDLPGYGDSVGVASSSDLEDLAAFCLDHAPDNAVWVGWSLGGMATIKAAMMCHAGKTGKRIRAMQLIATTACFVAQKDGVAGVDEAIFERFSNELAKNYESTLSAFLLLQAGRAQEARAIADRAHQAVCQLPSPSVDTLRSGIDCLLKTDLRDAIAGCVSIRSIPTQVIACTLDRVANPAGSKQLSDLMGAELTTIRSGHAPFLSDPNAVIEPLVRLMERSHD